MHLPGHWVALTRPADAQAEQAAALLCDSLHRRPFALSVEEVGEFFAIIAARQQGANEYQAGEWSLSVLSAVPGRDVVDEAPVIRDATMPERSTKARRLSTENIVCEEILCDSVVRGSVSSGAAGSVSSGAAGSPGPASRSSTGGAAR